MQQETRFERLYIAALTGLSAIPEITNELTVENALILAEKSEAALSAREAENLFKSPEIKGLWQLPLSHRCICQVTQYLRDNTLILTKHMTEAHLQKISISEFALMRNVGKKTVHELKLYCEANNIKLKD
jgi:hypothetical protein